MATYSDDFNRSDSTNIGANWAEDNGEWAITSNTLRQSISSGAYRKVRWVGGAMDSNNYYSEAQGRSDNGALGFGVFARGAASSTVTYYAILGFPGDQFYLVEITAGAETVLASGGTCNSSTTYTLRITVDGSSITGNYGAGTLSATDSSITTGAPGCMCYGELSGTNRWLDNWSASDLAGAAATSRLIFPARMPLAILAR